MGINLKLITENTKTNFLNFRNDLESKKKVEEEPIEEEEDEDNSQSLSN